MFENLRQNFIILLQEKIDYTKEYKKTITPTYVYKTKEKSNWYPENKQNLIDLILSCFLAYVSQLN